MGSGRTAGYAIGEDRTSPWLRAIAGICGDHAPGLAIVAFSQMGIWGKLVEFHAALRQQRVGMPVIWQLLATVTQARTSTILAPAGMAEEYSHVRALRNRHIKKPWRGVSQKSLRNRGVPPRGSKKPATYTAAHGALSRGEEHTHSFSGP